jgi:hypothetical protein
MKQDLHRRACHRTLLLATLAAAGLCLCSPLQAQHSQKDGGSPLDTIMRTRLWADVPDAKDFVRESRPPSEDLSYQPLTGSNPERPAPKTKTELEALRSELESAAARNESQAGRRRKP